MAGVSVGVVAGLPVGVAVGGGMVGICGTALGSRSVDDGIRAAVGDGAVTVDAGAQAVMHAAASRKATRVSSSPFDRDLPARVAAAAQRGMLSSHRSVA